ncbi:hypothetical protein A3K86_10925 [Photobacterium jeanii]|uniref:C-type lysozyme inhibitor domain-containing protein n=1 Tax=Photobacterium jeanii TaxID=858640 RepID=A0A178KAV1_9GAMM|nr:MliC family protein [Photobacterium jeanii]OAN14095.1 hypothetical protein A3K86_10925 [Photobacterium jeanii]PST89612.1 hypothetical protein C9I91_11535 [Photobacterium jeanii]
MRRLMYALGIVMVAGCSVEQSAFPVEINYTCPKGQFFTARYPDAESAVVYYLNDVRTLRHTRSASGAQYRDASEQTMLFTKGDEAMLEWDDYRLNGCRAGE